MRQLPEIFRNAVPRISKSSKQLAWLTLIIVLFNVACGGAEKRSDSGGVSTQSAATETQMLSGVYSIAFNVTGSTANAIANVVEGGKSLLPAIRIAKANPGTSTPSGVSINSINFPTSSQCEKAAVPFPCALVSYATVGASGNLLSSNQRGYGVQDGDKWLVAKKTYCKQLATTQQGIDGC